MSYVVTNKGFHCNAIVKVLGATFLYGYLEFKTIWKEMA